MPKQARDDTIPAIFIPVYGVHMKRQYQPLLAAGALLFLIAACAIPLPSLSPRPTPTLLKAPALPTAEPTQIPTTAPTLPATQQTLDPAVQQEIESLQTQVISLRGLQPALPVQLTLLSPQDLHQHVLDDFFADYSAEEAQTDARILALFGFLEPDFDLWTLYVDLYTEQIAGYYDTETRQLYVVAGEEFGGPERFYFVHEYDHFLQDQAFGLEEGLGLNDEDCDADSEACAAATALIEGDATLIQEQWLRTYATAQDIQEIIAEADTYESSVYDSAPPFMQQDLLFPYTEGLTFVRQLHLQGGWASVDAAYRDPPRSTEQILHPELYPSDQPVALLAPQDVAAALGSGWNEIDRGTLGEWYFRLMLEQYLSSTDALEPSAGWGGDYYLGFYNEDLDAGALVLLISWDRSRDALQAFDALEIYGTQRFGDGSAYDKTVRWEGEAGFALLELSSYQTLWIIAPDRESGELLRQAVRFPAEKQ
jgi:hypothetical protein